MASLESAITGLTKDIGTLTASLAEVKASLDRFLAAVGNAAQTTAAEPAEQDAPFDDPSAGVDKTATAKVYTMQEVAAAIDAALTKKGAGFVRETLTKFNVQRVRDLKESDLGAFVRALEAA